MADFHFIRPYWLIAIVGLIFVLYLLKKYRIGQSGWHKLLPNHLASALVDGNTQNKSASVVIPFLIGLLAIVALAGPTWKKLPQPVYQLARGSVLIMDMSYSMYSTDVTPNRLTRARYKAIDLLEQLNEGEMGLIAYAGDAFVISPLTEDVNNIGLLLPSLSPDLMPELGSNPYAALVLAGETLKNAGHIEGDIYWFTDGIDTEDIQDIVDWMRESPYRLNIMGIGSTSGAPIKLPNGQLLKDDSGAIVIPKLSENDLKTVVRQGSGVYARMANDNADIEKLIQPPLQNKDEKQAENAQTGDQWQEFGPYLLLLILPLILPYFRRGNLLAVLPLGFLLLPAPQAQADFWKSLWKTPDQQGQTLFNNEQFKEAADTFDNAMWRGSAHYQAGNYEQALKAFQTGTNANAFYNQGNALAKLQQFDQAIAAYEQALTLNPDHQSAKENKALLEKLKEQQEQQNQQNSQQNDQQQDQQGDQSQQNQQQNGQNDQNEQQDQQENTSQSDQKQQDGEQQENDQASEPDAESEQEKQEAEQPAESEPKNEEQQNAEQQAQLSQAQQEKETEQKHKQLLNKVTDDPYLLLRNKMQLEYQKRRQNKSRAGVSKKW